MATSLNMLFYSNQCKMCQSLLVLLKNENMLQYFKCICVDDPIIQNKLPRSITTVPTAIIPSINKQFVAAEIFGWVQSVRNSKNQRAVSNRAGIQPQQYTTAAAQPQNGQPQKPMGPRAPIGFISQEMSGLSDTYAYTMVDEVPPHTYLSCNDLDKTTIFTAPEKQGKITQNLQPSYLKDVERKRKEQDANISQIFEQQKQNISFIKNKRQEVDQMISNIVEKQQQNIVSLLD